MDGWHLLLNKNFLKPLFESSSEEIEFIKTRVQQIKSRVVDGEKDVM